MSWHTYDRLQSNDMYELARYDLMRIEKVQYDQQHCPKMMQFVYFDNLATLGGKLPRQHVKYELRWLQEQPGAYTSTTYFPGWTTAAMKQYQQQQYQHK